MKSTSDYGETIKDRGEQKENGEKRTITNSDTMSIMKIVYNE